MQTPRGWQPRLRHGKISKLACSRFTASSFRSHTMSRYPAPSSRVAMAAHGTGGLRLTATRNALLFSPVGWASQQYWDASSHSGGRRAQRLHVVLCLSSAPAPMLPTPTMPTSSRCTEELNGAATMAAGPADVGSNQTGTTGGGSRSVETKRPAAFPDIAAAGYTP